MSDSDKEKPALTKAEISRINGAKSTGPKTPAGKECSRMNALKHGILAKILVVGGESEDDFNSLLQDSYDDLQPESGMEGLLVNEIAGCVWRLRRATLAEKGEIEKQRCAASRDSLLMSSHVRWMTLSETINGILSAFRTRKQLIRFCATKPQLVGGYIRRWTR